MKWGHYGNLSNPELEMLLLVIHQIVTSEMRVARATGDFGRRLDKFLRKNGGAMGDPEYEITHIPESGGYGHYEAYCGIEPVPPTKFDALYVVNLTREVLCAYANKFPEEKVIAKTALKRMKGCEEKLKS